MGISGAELAGNAQLQAQKFGARISVPRSAVELRLKEGLRVVALDDGSQVTTRCVLVAGGAEYRTLDVPGIHELEGAGVYYAATEMAGQFCRGEETVIVGGGNSAGQAALFLSRFARQVHVVIRGDDLGRSMSHYLVDQVQRVPNVRVHRGTQVVAVAGGEALREVTLRDAAGEETVIPTRALFVFIGARPRTGWLPDCVSLDPRGFVLTGGALPPEVRVQDAWGVAGRTPHFLETSLPGVFAAGDVRAGSVKRVASAVGEGAMVVTFVHSHIGATA